MLYTNVFTIHKFGHASNTFFPIPPTLNEGVACKDYRKLCTVFAVIQVPPQYKSHSVLNLILMPYIKRHTLPGLFLCGAELLGCMRHFLVENGWCTEVSAELL